jgi:hypothetical protein
MAKRSRFEIFMPPNVLKAKVGGGVFTGLDPKIIKRAESAVERIKIQYPNWLVEDIDHLTDTWNTFQTAPSVTTAAELYRASHDLKGQAPTFDYPTIGRMAQSLCQLISAVSVPSKLPLTLVEAHVAAIRAAYKERAQDFSDQTLIVLIEELEAKVQLVRDIVTSKDAC